MYRLGEKGGGRRGGGEGGGRVYFSIYFFKFIIILIWCCIYELNLKEEVYQRYFVVWSCLRHQSLLIKKTVLRIHNSIDVGILMEGMKCE